MELLSLYSLILIFLSLSLATLYHHRCSRKHDSGSLPPGKMGLPVVGETWQYLSAGWKGHPEKFIFDRLSKYAPNKVFKTSIIGEKTVVMSGASSNKFLFSNENKLVQVWWPRSLDKIFLPSSTETSLEEEGRKLRRLGVPNFLKPDALQRYIPIMDTISIQHFAAEWKGKDMVEVHPLAKRYTFWLSCRLFLSIEEKAQVDKLAGPFKDLTSGLFSIPINLPGMPFHRGIEASKLIRTELIGIIKQRKAASPTRQQDILSHLLLTPFEDSRYMSEMEIAGWILGLLVGGYDSASTTCTFIVKYLAEFPHIYDAVYQEQMEIGRSKAPGELLNWEDIQKMKYSWNVACEVLRLVPPLQGGFREAIDDFIYEDFRISKGWKLYWSAYSTHKDPEYFPEPEKFDPSRFEGNGPAPYTYVPFGGGPRMCPGKEYSRLQILVFMHNLVKRFKWEQVVANEQIVVKPFPAPSKGLPIRLHPHPKTC